MLPEQILHFFARYIEVELGIVYSEHNYFQLQNRLEEITKLLGLSSLEALHQQAEKGITGAFRQLLLDLATNNETSFFRDPKIFKAIEQHLGARGPGPLSIWSAASSSGQEALSVAMLVLEWCEKNKRLPELRIIASDISERILTKAKAATYTQLEIQRGLPAPLMVKYFTKDSQDLWTAKDELTRKIEYRRLNLKDAYAFDRRFDLVLCRNVLIYHAVEGKRDIISRIHRTLSDSGVLILGAGESLIGLSEDFVAHTIEGAVVYQKKSASQTLAA